MAEKLIGEVTHYYGKLGVGIVKLKAGLKVGDKIKFKSHEGDLFEQEVQQIQFNHKDIQSAKAKQDIGIRVDQKVHEGNEVYLVE